MVVSRLFSTQPPRRNAISQSTEEFLEFPSQDLTKNDPNVSHKWASKASRGVQERLGASGGVCAYGSVQANGSVWERLRASAGASGSVQERQGFIPLLE